jgi:hypothetical protein
MSEDKTTLKDRWNGSKSGSGLVRLLPMGDLYVAPVRRIL